jgi:hypothetical protein
MLFFVHYHTLGGTVGRLRRETVSPEPYIEKTKMIIYRDT